MQSHFGYFFSIFQAAVLSFVCYAYADVKIWSRNTNYNNTNNWNPKRLPSDTDLVVFPFYMNVEIMLSSEMSICEIVLPYSGLILFPTHGFLQINGHDCDPTHKVNFVRNKIEKWENPLNWLSKKRNKATPHAFRLPCTTDDVIFPPSSTFAVGLPPAPTAVKSFNFNYQYLDSEELRSFLVDSVSGRKQFIKDDDDTVIPIVSGAECKDPSGCSCGTERLMHLSCDAYVSRLCAPPMCLEPIRPIGHCCNICGVIMELQFDPKKFKMLELKQILNSFVTLVQNQRNLDVVYHVGKTDSGTIQIVLVEKDGYEGAITEVASQLKANLLSDAMLGLSLSKLLLSGEPVGPSEILFVFKTFFAIVLMIIGGFLCVMLYRSDMNFDQLFSSSTFTNFVRFENQTGEVELRYEVQPQLRKSFHNPLFQTAVEDDDAAKPEKLSSDEPPSTSYSNPVQETPVPESKNDTNDVELDEIPATKLDEKLMHDVDLS